MVQADGNTSAREVKTGRFTVNYQQDDVIVESPGIEADGGVSIDADAGTLSAEGEIGLPNLDAMDATHDGNGDATDESTTMQRTLQPETRGGFHGLSVTATNRDDIETYTLTLVGSNNASIAVSAGVNIVTAETTAFIGTAAKINADDNGAAHPSQSVHVAAGHDFAHVAIAGSIAIAGVGVALAPAVGTTVLKQTTLAHVGAGATLQAQNDISVEAHGVEDLLLVGAGIAGGAGAFGGAVDVVVINNQVEAVVGAGATLSAGGDVLVLASDDSDLDVIAGALGAGIAGAGASIGVMSVTKSTDALIGSGAIIDAKGSGNGVGGIMNGNQVGDGDDFATTTAHGLIVQAESSEDILQLAVAAGVGLVGVAGGIAVTTIDSDTSALISGNALINQTDENAGADADQSVFVNAGNQLRAFSFAGAVSGGLAALGRRR